MKKILLLCIICLSLVIPVSFAMEGAPIIIIIGETDGRGISTTPVFCDICGDGTKKIAFLSRRINDDDTTDDFLYAKEADGTDTPGWPYIFPQTEWTCSDIAVCDINNDGVDEIIVKGGVKNTPTLFIKVLRHTAAGPEIINEFYFDEDRVSFTHVTYAYWSNQIAVGNVDDDAAPEIIAFERIFKLDGRSKSLFADITPGGTPFIIGTPMVTGSHILFQTVEVPDLSMPAKDIAHALYCVRVNWDGPNTVAWRIDLGTSQYDIYRWRCWAELGAGLLGGTGTTPPSGLGDIAATYNLDDKFMYKAIGPDGTILKSLDLTRQAGFNTDYYIHTRFVIADIGNGGSLAGRQDVIFFPGASEPGFWSLPLSQPACAFIDEDEDMDFVFRGDFGINSDGAWHSAHGFFKSSPYLANPASIPYEPVICPLNKDNIESMIETSADNTTYYSSILHHVALADLAEDGYFAVAGTRPTGDGLDLFNFTTHASSVSDWKQAYGAGERTNCAQRLEPIPPPNQPPVLDPIGNKTAWEGEPLELIVSASDPDGDTLIYSVENLPQGAVFDSNTHTLNWTPGYEQSGDYDVTFTVSDGRLSAAETIKITAADNIAYLKPVTSRVREDPYYCIRRGYQAGNLTNGDIRPTNLAYPGSFTFDYVVDLEDTYAVETVKLYLGFYGITKGYITAWELLASDNPAVETSWQSIKKVTTMPGPIMIAVTLPPEPNRPIRALRIRAWGQNWIGMCQLTAFGKKVSLPPPVISIELNEASWMIGNVKLGEIRNNLDAAGMPIHRIRNTGNTAVSLDIGYGPPAGGPIQPGSEQGLDRFVTKFGAGNILPPAGRIGFAFSVKPQEEICLPLIYGAPTVLSDQDIKEMSAGYEIRAYPAME